MSSFVARSGISRASNSSCAAAESLTQPRLDAVGGYQVNAFGENLFDSNSSGPSGGDFLVPGQRRPDRLAGRPADERARSASAPHTPRFATTSFASPAPANCSPPRNSKSAMSSPSRSGSRPQLPDDALELPPLSSPPKKTSSGREPRFRLGEELIDMLLRAYERRAQAEQTYYQSVTEYNQALATPAAPPRLASRIQRRSPLRRPLAPEAYGDAARQHKARHTPSRTTRSTTPRRPSRPTTPIRKSTTVCRSHSAARRHPSHPRPPTNRCPPRHRTR